mgnify:CR=1 FL=1
MCEYCEYEEEIDFSYSTGTIDGCELTVDIGAFWGSVTINYCPMCGKELKED